MNKFGLFLFGVLFAVLMLAPYAYAETIPSTQTTSTEPATLDHYGYPQQNPSWVPPTYTQSGCTTAFTSYHGSQNLAPFTVELDPNDSNCHAYSNTHSYVGSLAANWTCPSGSTMNGRTCEGVVTYSCPAGYALSADQQTCTKQDCQAGIVVSKGVYFGQTISSPGCINGCTAAYSGQQPWDSASGWIYIGQYTNTGSTCQESSGTPEDVPTPTPPEATDPPTTSEYDCVSRGMSYGQVNGVTVCVPAGTPGTPPMIEPPQKETQANPDGTTTETQTQDSQNGTNITRNTTVITRDAQGNVISEETTSTTASQGAFCEQNPDAAICAESKTSGGGNCETPPSSEGDAIQAAILKQAWETRCESKKTNTALGEGSALATELAGVGETAMTGDPLDRTSITDTIDVSGQISTEKFLSGGCIPDKVITGLPMGKTLTIPFSELCPYLEIFGNLMVIMAMLAAARIVGVS